MLKRPSVLPHKITTCHLDSLVLYHPVFVFDLLARDWTNEVIFWVKIIILFLELPCCLRLDVKIPFDYGAFEGDPTIDHSWIQHKGS